MISTYIRWVTFRQKSGSIFDKNNNKSSKYIQEKTQKLKSLLDNALKKPFTSAS
jgi:hypothetical protein